MNDPRRIKVPWYSWRWRLGLLFPMALFALLAAITLTDVRSHPFLSIAFGTIFLVFVLLLARQSWRERYPRRLKVNRPTVDAGNQIPQ